MVPQLVLDQFINDCTTLLKRALLGKTLACFGADGNGQYGQHTFARHYPVLDLDIIITADSDDVLHGKAHIALLGYDSNVDGHVVTDANLKMSINKEFNLEYIDTDCWSWAPVEDQGSCYFTIDFSPTKMLFGEP